MQGGGPDQATPAPGGLAPAKDDNDVFTPFLPPNLCQFIR